MKTVSVFVSHVIGISMVATALRLDFGSEELCYRNRLLQGTILEIRSFGGHKISMKFAHKRYRTAAIQWQGQALTCRCNRGPQNVMPM